MAIREPRAGFLPKSILETEGVAADGSGDHYAPPHGAEAQAIALGLPPQEPVSHTIVEASWSGLTPVTIPAGGLAGNLAGGDASGVLAQWVPVNEGHFVIYEIPAAMTQVSGFLENLAADPKGRVPKP